MPDGFTSLMYHNVVADDAAAARPQTDGLSPSITGYFVTAWQFEQHLAAIARCARVITVADVAKFYAVPSVDVDSGRPAVHITFDDGWRETVDIAGPLLAARGLQATLFVTTGLIGRSRFLTPAELARLPQDTFHVGSHTVSHPFLNELADADVADELRRSRGDLEDILGREVDSLSIPNGAADRRVIRIAADSGYRFVYLSTVHRNTQRRGPLAIGRAAIRATTTAAAVARYACGQLGPEQARAALLSLPKRILGPSRYRRLRRLVLGEPADAQDMRDLVIASDHHTEFMRPPADCSQSTSRSASIPEVTS